jgi:hypothetical protein
MKRGALLSALLATCSAAALLVSAMPSAMAAPCVFTSVPPHRQHQLKSRRGQCSPSQRAVREALLRVGAQWWVCRSANAAMWALIESGVTFRVISNDDGSTERWQQPKLPAWEVPKRDPHERRPRAPDYWEPEAAAEIVELAATSDDAAGGDIAAEA